MSKSFFKITLDDTDYPLILTSNPIGITEFELTYTRHQIYNTVFPAVGTALKFVHEGYDYIKSVFNVNGLDGVCGIKIEEQQLINKTYSTVFEGVIDFSTYTEFEDYIEVNVLENDLMTLFLSREKTEVNIIAATDIDGLVVTPPTLTNLELSPIEPTLWAVADGCKVNDTQSGTTDYSDFLDPSGLVSVNMIGSDFNETTKAYENNTVGNVLATIEYDVTFEITGNIEITSLTPPPPANELSFTINMIRLDTGGLVPVTTKSISSISSLSLDETINMSGKFETSIPNGGFQGIKVQIVVNFSSCVGTYDFVVETTFNTYDIYYKDITGVGNVTIKSIEPVVLGNSILKVMGIDTATAPFTSTELGNIFLASGRGIRQFPSNTPINISFRDFFLSYSSLFGLGFFYDSSGFEFKKLEDYYDQTSTPFAITESTNVDRSIALDWYFSNINVGYNNRDYEIINGRLEFNTHFNFITVNKNTDSELNIINPVQADSIGIEILRRNPYYSSGSDDVKGEDKNYFISAILDTGVYRAELGSDFTTVSGFRDPDQFYNYRITPKRCLINNGLFVNTSLNYKSKAVSYISSKNEIDLVVDGVSELDGDYDDTASGNLIPVVYTFETILTTALRTFLNNTPNNPISIVYGGSTIKLFIQECKVIPYSKAVTIKGISF